MSEPIVATRIEQAVKAYIQACNDGDAETIAACFCSEAVHYFPTGPKWSGASTIGANFSKRLRELGHLWTVDMVLDDADGRAAALEWTQFAKNGRVLRGVDWFVFKAGRSEFRRFALTAPPQSNPTSSARSCGISITSDVAIR
jgi:SnoaL-like domain